MNGNASSGPESKFARRHISESLESATDKPNGSQPPAFVAQSQDERAVESALVAKAQKDAQAFGELYELYIDRIYSYVYSRVQNAQDAEDLTARIFYRAAGPPGSVRGQGAALWRMAVSHRPQSGRQLASGSEPAHVRSD